MKKILVFQIIMLILIVFVGCDDSGQVQKNISIDSDKLINTQSEVSNDAENKIPEIFTDYNPKLSNFLAQNDGLKLFKDELPSEFKEVTGEEKEIKGGYVYVTKEFNEVRSFDEQVVFTKSDVIYPGAIFRGDSLLQNEYIPINLPRNAIDISLSLQGNIIVKSEIDNPRVVSSAREAINELLNQDGLEGPASLTFNVSEITSSNQLSLKLGSGIGVNGISLGFGISPSTLFEKSRKFAQFTQRYYSVGVDRPQYLSNFFDPSVTEEQIIEASNGYMPVYVSNVIYGRRGIFELETEYDSESLEKAFSVGYGVEGIGVSGEIKDAVSSSMKKSDMKLYILGGDGNSAVEAIDSYEAFVNHIQSGGRYSSSNRGEIIGFELRYLHDDSIAKTVINESYKVTEKVPRNRYISYDVSYIEAYTEADSNGVQLDRFEIFIDRDNEPLWGITSDKIGSSIYQLMSSDLKVGIYNNKRISFDEVRKNRTVRDGNAWYYKWKPKQILYTDPNKDVVKFDTTLGGSFWYQPSNSMFVKSKKFTLNESIVFDIKSIEEDEVIILKVTDDEFPSYSFEIGIEVNVIYEDQIDSVYTPVIRAIENGSEIRLEWSTYDKPEEPYSYISVSKSNLRPSYPDDGYTRPDYNYRNKQVRFFPGKSGFENADFEELVSGETYNVSVTVVYDDGKSWTSEPIQITMP